MKALLTLIESIQPLSKGSKEYLGKVLKHRKFLKKEFLLRAGDVSKSVFFITQGLIRAYYFRGPKEVNSWFMKEGDMSLSIESFYDQTASYESIQALEDCDVYSIDFPELEYMYQTFPEFNIIGRVLTIKYHKLWAQQLYSIRAHDARARYYWLRDNHPDLLLRVPAKYIASYLDVTEVTLSKIKGKRRLSRSSINKSSQLD